MSTLRLAFVVSCLQAATAAPETLVNWPQFRGADGAGVADSSTLPARWSATENVAWSADLPGRGWSSPIVWGDRVYVTTAVNAGGFKAASTGHLRQRLRGGAREAGADGGRDHEAGRGAGHRARLRIGGRQLRSARPRRADGQGGVAARGPSREARRRAAPQEHLRLRDAGHGRRAGLRLFRRQRRPLLLLAGGRPPLEADLARLSPSTWTSAPRRRPWCTAGACTSSTTTRASRSSWPWTRRPDTWRGR